MFGTFPFQKVYHSTDQESSMGKEKIQRFRWEYYYLFIFRYFFSLSRLSLYYTTSQFLGFFFFFFTYYYCSMNFFILPPPKFLSYLMIFQWVLHFEKIIKYGSSKKIWGRPRPPSPPPPYSLRPSWNLKSWKMLQFYL